MVEDVHVFPKRVLLHRLNLFLGKLVASVVDLLVVADWLAWSAPLDPRLPRLAQSGRVHTSLSSLSTCVLPDQIRRNKGVTNCVKEINSGYKKLTLQGMQ